MHFGAISVYFITLFEIQIPTRNIVGGIWQYLNEVYKFLRFMNVMILFNINVFCTKLIYNIIRLAINICTRSMNFPQHFKLYVSIIDIQF